MARSKVEARRNRLRLSILEVPWDPEGREIVRAEMDELGINRDRLYFLMVDAGWEGSHTKIGRWLRGENKPDADELGVLTGVLAAYSANWPKASNLSSPEMTYTFWDERELVPA